MINASSAFRRKLNNDERDYLEQISMTLKDGTELSLTNADIWGGSLSFDDSVGSDSSFSALGSCIVNSLKFTLNNIYDDFSEYDFLDAVATVKIGLDIDGTPEMLKKGVFTVVDPTYNGSTISLVLHDNMAKFDRPYSDSTLVYPASLDTIVRNLCTVCGVNLATSSLNFPRKDFVINERPSDEATTCREVLSWCATIVGCFARCNTDGELELKWFNTDSFGTASESLDGGRFDNHDPNVYVTGDTADGGTFNPWNTGDAYDGGSFDYTSIHIINSLYSQNIAVDDVVITQIQAEVKVKADTGDAVVTYSEGQSGYAIKISGNEFINETNAQNIVSYLGNQIIGTTFRKANVSHASDPTIEAGDCAFVYDRKGNRYNILITRTNFTVGSAQTTVCGADTPARNSAARYTEQTKSYVEIRKKLIEQKSEWEQAVDDLSDRIDNAGGMFETDVQQTGGGVIHYLHNKPLLAESDIRIVVSDVGVTVTANGTDPNPTWYGLTVDGQLIASILNVIGINASWINTGQLVIKDQNNNETFFADTATGVVRINATQLTINSNPVPSSADLNDAKKVATNYLSYNNSDGITLGYVNTNEKININADGMELYDGSNNQIAQFKAVTRLGKTSGANLRLDYHSLQLQDINGNTYVHLSDLRDTSGYAVIEDTFVGDGSTTTFTLSNNITYVSQVQSVKINNVATTDYTVSTSASLYNDKIIFTTAPANKSTISITYKTNDSMRAFTFGSRDSNGNIGGGSFVNGSNVIASGGISHAEGIGCKARARSSHAEGYYSNSDGEYSHAEGENCTASGKDSHCEGHYCEASGNTAHAEGYWSVAEGLVSHAEGERGTASGYGSHIEGTYCTTNTDGKYAHAEGGHCAANNEGAHSEGYYSIASGKYSHAEGYTNTASGYCSHAEGRESTASNDYSHAEGQGCTASGSYAHAEGNGCKASAIGSHAEGKDCTATGQYSHAEGISTTANYNYQHVIGYHNVTANQIFIVGCGNTSQKKNALTLNSGGNMTIAGTLTQSSDKRLKHHRAYLSDQEQDVNEFVNQLKPVWFEKDEQKHLGFYAQDVQQSDKWNCMVDMDTNGYLTLGYTEIIAPLVAYCQNQQKKIESLEGRIARLEQLLNNQ